MRYRGTGTECVTRCNSCNAVSPGIKCYDCTARDLAKVSGRCTSCGFGLSADGGRCPRCVAESEDAAQELAGHVAWLRRNTRPLQAACACGARPGEACRTGCPHLQRAAELASEAP